MRMRGISTSFRSDVKKIIQRKIVRHLSCIKAAVNVIVGYRVIETVDVVETGVAGNHIPDNKGLPVSVTRRNISDGCSTADFSRQAQH